MNKDEQDDMQQTETTEMQDAPAPAEDAQQLAATRPGMQWYIVHAMSRYEKKVCDLLQQRIKEEGLEDKFGRLLVPSEEIIELKSGQKRKVERLFYPGYILIEMAMDPDCWQMVRHTRHVRGFIGGLGDPTPVPEEEAFRILSRQEATRTSKPRMTTIFEVGEVVRVTKGPFADFSGTVEDVNYAKSRLWVAISIFGRTTSTELSFNHVVRE